MFKCTECDAIFDEPETWQESRGEFWGFPCSETVSGCPKCRGDYGKAFECKKCGEWFFEDELSDGLCGCCQDELFN